LTQCAGVAGRASEAYRQDDTCAPLLRACAHDAQRLMAEDDDAAACCAALFDVEAAGSAAAAAALARVPQRKGSYADAAYWRSRYSAELVAVGDAAPPPQYEWCVCFTPHATLCALCP
jgi:hypothetical protein